MLQLWAEKYKPKKIEDYVFTNEKLKRDIDSWVTAGAMPHLLMFGKPGVGKTSLFNLMMNLLEVDDVDILKINGSKQNGIDVVRDRITKFAEKMPFGEFKYILVDEADGITSAAQAALRSDIEEYQDFCRFVFTCNYVNRIIPALKSRLSPYEISALDKQQYAVRLVGILNNENIEIDNEVLGKIIGDNWPDMRAALRVCQQCSMSGKLEMPETTTEKGGEWEESIDKFYQNGDLQEVRKSVCANVRAEEYGDVFTYIYQNLEKISTDRGKQENVILAVRDSMFKHPACADPEINLAALFINIKKIQQSE